MQPDRPERELLSLLKAGDQEAIKILFNQYGRRLFVTINRIIHNSEAAKDLVQNVFFKLWKKREELDIVSIEPYLVKAAINEGLSYQRANHFVKHVHIDAASGSYAPSEEAEGLEYAEMETLLNLTIASMPPQRRVVFTLSRFEQLSYAQIASHLNISEKTVEKHISKALVTLRTVLKPYLKLLLIFMA